MTRLLQSLEYLETRVTDLEYLKIKEVAAQLRAEGYEVTESPTGADAGFDLIATKDGKRLAVKVKVNSQVPNSTESAWALNQRAIEQGLDEFRLILVSPPHERIVKIAGLESNLKSQLESKLQQPGQIPEKVFEEWNFQGIESVVEIDVSSVEITLDGIRVTGMAIARVWSSPILWQHVDEPRQIFVDHWNLPFNFDVKLSHELEISEVYKLEIDSSSLADD